ncbi:hypothetical protein TL16_g05156 [Triparma laevis f. inornata]|uniref:RING-type domain-containing protein n=1 Tax=Triparma laevis f. inornata TaxID=1714386 RepID=A0A9W7AHT7_9STRA|nr:hypothetical protein TL16_g05156 [Triparma laevis f. inornata]
MSRDESLFLAKLGVGVTVRTATGGGAGGGSERCTQCTRLKSNPKCVCDGEAPGRASGGGGGRTGDVSKKVVAMLTIRVLVCAKWRIRRRPRVDAARKIARCWRRYRSWCMVLDRLASLSAQYQGFTSERLDHACRVIQTWWRVRGEVFSYTCCVCYEDKVERILVGNGKTVSVFVDNPCGHKVCRWCAYLCAKRNSKCVICRQLVSVSFFPSSLGDRAGQRNNGFKMSPAPSILVGTVGLKHWSYWGGKDHHSTKLASMLDKSLPRFEFDRDFPNKSMVIRYFDNMFKDLYSDLLIKEFADRVKITLDPNYSAMSGLMRRIIVGEVFYVPCTVSLRGRGTRDFQNVKANTRRFLQNCETFVTRFNRIFEEHAEMLGVRLIADRHVDVVKEGGASGDATLVRLREMGW